MKTRFEDEPLTGFIETTQREHNGINTARQMYKAESGKLGGAVLVELLRPSSSSRSLLPQQQSSLRNPRLFISITSARSS